MAKCKACGAEIRFIPTAAGKKMPVNAEPVTYEQDMNGMFTILGPGGVIERGRLVVAGSKKGYIPHWTTCPDADMFRRR